MPTSRVRRSTVSGGSLLASMMVGASFPTQALILDVHPFIKAGYGYTTNIFSTNSSAENQALTNGGPRGDGNYHGAIGTELTMTQSLQRLEVDGEYGYNRYEEYGQLDGSNYKVKARADLAVGSTLGSTLTGSQERILAPFYSGDRTAPSFQTETKAAAELYYRITPRFSLKPEVDLDRLRESLDTQQDVDLNEYGRQFAVEYSREPLSAAGLKFRDATGRFPERQVVPGSGREKDYTQRTYSGYTRYSPSGLSQLRLELGYTQRTHEDTSVPNYSGLTGTLAYRRTISGKTYGEIEVFRDLQTIDEVGINFVQETGVSAVFNYAWSVKTALAFGYEYLDDSFLGSSTQDPEDNNRSDRIQQWHAGVEYNPTSKLLLTPQVRYEDHSSTREDRTYNFASFGIDVRYRY